LSTDSISTLLFMQSIRFLAGMQAIIHRGLFPAFSSLRTSGWEKNQTTNND
jgi:hypothetical protein